MKVIFGCGTEDINRNCHILDDMRGNMRCTIKKLLREEITLFYSVILNVYLPSVLLVVQDS